MRQNKTPYLVQRFTLKGFKEGECFFKAVSFHYMGSVEFEVGTLWDTLVKNHKTGVTYFGGTAKLSGMIFHYVAPSTYTVSEVIDILSRLWLGGIHTKERTEFSEREIKDTIRRKKTYEPTDSWVDIETGLFWTRHSINKNAVIQAYAKSVEICTASDEVPVVEKPKFLPGIPASSDTRPDRDESTLRERMIADGRLRPRD